MAVRGNGDVVAAARRLSFVDRAQLKTHCQTDPHHPLGGPSQSVCSEVRELESEVYGIDHANSANLSCLEDCAFRLSKCAAGGSDVRGCSCGWRGTP